MDYNFQSIDMELCKNGKLYWWLCVDFMHDRNMYAIGSSLGIYDSYPSCYLIEFKKASSVTNAEVCALEE